MVEYIRVLILILVFFDVPFGITSLVAPGDAFGAQEARIRYVYSIAGNKEIGTLGLLGGAFFDEKK